MISMSYDISFSAFWVFFHCFYLEKCDLRKMFRFLDKSCVLWSCHLIHFKFATWFHCIILINMWVITSWYLLQYSAFLCFHHCFNLKECGAGKMLSDLIKSCSLLSCHQNHLKFGMWIHCIIPHTIWWFEVDIFYYFLNFSSVFT